MKQYIKFDLRIRDELVMAIIEDRGFKVTWLDKPQSDWLFSGMLIEFESKEDCMAYVLQYGTYIVFDSYKEYLGNEYASGT